MSSAATVTVGRSYTGYLLIAMAAALWATAGPISRALYDHGVTPLEVSFWRTATAAVLFIVALIATGGGRGIHVSALSLFWGLAAAMTYAAYYLVGKWATSRYSPLQILAYVFPVAAAAILPFVEFGTYSAAAILWLALLSIATTYAPYLLYYRGLPSVQISRAVVVATIEPVIAAVFAAVFFSELYSARAFIGAVFVLAAATRASLPEHNSKSEPAVTDAPAAARPVLDSHPPDPQEEHQP